MRRRGVDDCCGGAESVHHPLAAPCAAVHCVLVLGAGYSFTSTTLPIYYTERFGMHVATIGSLYSALAFLYAATCFAMGSIADRFPSDNLISFGLACGLTVCVWQASF